MLFGGSMLGSPILGNYHVMGLEMGAIVDRIDRIKFIQHTQR